MKIKLKPGDWAQYDRWGRGLDNLGIFSEVKVGELAASPESVNISIQVREGEQNYGSLGQGWKPERG